MDSTIKILELILLKQAVTRDALLSLNAGDCDSVLIKESDNGETRYIAKINQHLHYTIKKLKDNNLIVEEKQINKLGSMSYTFYYYTVTGAGVGYLKDHCEKDDAEHPWLAYAECDERKKVSNRADAGESLARMLLVAETAVFSEMAGAAMPLDIFDRTASIEELVGKKISGELGRGRSLWEEENPNSGRKYVERKNKQSKDKIRQDKIQTNSSIISRARVKYISTELERSNREGDENPRFTFDDLLHPGNPVSGNPEDESYIRFVNDKSVKYSIAASRSIECCHDVNRANLVGLLQSRTKTLFLKNTHSPEFIWYKNAAEGEQNLWGMWVENLKEEYRQPSKEAGMCGALLVQNSRRFAKIFEGRTASGYTSHVKIGGGYRHFYILPTNHDGAENLRRLMLINHESFYREEREKACGKEGYSLNTDELSKAFPLVYSAGDETMYVTHGYFIDTEQLYTIREAMRKTDKRAFIICSSWQIPYYKAVLDRVEYLTFGDNLEKP